MKRIITFLVLIFSLTGCYSARKAARQVIKAQSIFPEMVAENCGLWYPPKEFTRESTRYLRGKDSVIRDTAYVDCTKPGNIDKKDVLVPCNQTIRVDTFEKEVITKVENTATIQALNNKITKLQENNTILKTICAIAVGILGIFFILKIIRNGKST